MMYSYPHIYLQFNKNKVYIKHRLSDLFRFFIKKLKSKPVFCFSVDNFLITYGRFVAKHRPPLHTNGRKAITAIDPSKWPLTQKNIGFAGAYFFPPPAIASHTGAPYNLAPFDNRIDVKALV